ncbi:endo-1,4-beta-xylanase [Maribacter polysiphoniae]|uniref:Beta-xylanase n=1 Tax=Maribacter polysiphoniae TaxID=429344 RepID=A0A316DVF5_9FLAO|nr:endo-1,4-beta-xylanase [Maribacter polysiphoniae]MBD1261949.1 endo-1,4-beta-xylanase [Maribacter polysiphoniae]PWK22317.1 endo-1,4-beta-xylanase [Maribacter polysiphoniae]
MKHIIMKVNHLFLLLSVVLTVFSCSSDGYEPEPEPIIPVNKVQASFEYTISETDAHVLFLNNTSVGETDFTSVWDFGLGNGTVNDAAGLEEVTYANPGEYTIKLTVTNKAGKTEESKKIIVDENGICPNGICGSVSGEGLKGLATTFSVGMITRSSWVSGDNQYTDLLKQEFNNLTSEYEMKMNVMYPSEGNYDFSAADAIVNFAQANDMNVHGHALIWHNATPDWVTDFLGSDAEFEAMVQDYITTVVTRYKGKVRSWDVVNEAIDDGSGNPLRSSVFKDKMGDDYIRKCFQWARDADPDVLLFYNDYNIAASSSKRAAIFDLVDDLGNLIDGVGAQMHISYNGPSAADIQSVADATVSRGLKLHFSELDIRANPDGDQTTLTNERATAQKAKYKEVVQIYNAIPLDNKFALTVWGLRDNESWLIDFWGNPDWPLLFDENYNKKQAYQGYVEGLQ